MVKHRIRNIANRPVPVDGTNMKPMPGQIVKAEITPKLKSMIQNKFFEDLGEVPEIRKISKPIEVVEKEVKKVRRKKKAKRIEEVQETSTEPGLVIKKNEAEKMPWEM